MQTTELQQEVSISSAYTIRPHENKTYRSAIRTDEYHENSIPPQKDGLQGYNDYHTVLSGTSLFIMHSTRLCVVKMIPELP